MSCEGEGWKVVPMVHVHDLIKMVECVAGRLLGKDWKDTRPFYFAVDHSETTQMQLLETIHSICGITEPVGKSSSIIDSDKIQYSQIHLKANPSP